MRLPFCLTTLVVFTGVLALRTGISRGAEPTASSPPNFVLIVADDLGWGDVGFHGSTNKTPTLDRLAREGVELTQHYVNPMCSPTRAALMSGRFASRFGVTAAQSERAMPFDTITLPRLLASAGYMTAITGKWHLGSDNNWNPNRFGFQSSYGSLGGGVGPYNHKYKTGPFTDTWHRDGKALDEEGHVTDLITREAIRIIEAPRKGPLFLYVPFAACHVPVDEPGKWLDLYPEMQDVAKRHYLACLSHMDDGIAQIEAALKRTGIRDNTLLVFTSDNGATPTARNDGDAYPGTYPPGQAGGTNVPLRGNKTELYEGGIHVTAFANWPGRLKPGTFDAPIHAVDWFPTFAALAGVSPSQDLKWDGQNVWPALSGQTAPQPRTLYWAGVRFKSSAVRDGDWKLITYLPDEKKKKQPPTELFNLAADPYEKNNLADKEPARVEAMKKLLAEKASRDKDALPSDKEEGAAPLHAGAVKGGD